MWLTMHLPRQPASAATSMPYMVECLYVRLMYACLIHLCGGCQGIVEPSYFLIIGSVCKYA